MKAKFLMCLAATMVSLTTLAADQKLTVGFSQIGAESGWRTANTDSIKSEADKRGIVLKFADAQQKQEIKNQGVAHFHLARRGCDRIFAGG